MKRAILERNIALVLFVAVLILFSIAQKDSRKLEKLYTLDRQSINVQPREQQAWVFPYANPFEPTEQSK